MANDQGWETYSKLVIQQLETLNTGIESMRRELQDVKEQITKIKAKEEILIQKIDMHLFVLPHLYLVLQY